MLKVLKFSNTQVQHTFSRKEESCSTNNKINRKGSDIAKPYTSKCQIQKG